MADTGGVGPFKHEPNQYFSVRTYYDPCDDFEQEGVKFTIGSKDDVKGFYVISDCRIIHCDKYRERVQSTACANGCVSTTDVNYGGSTKIYELVPSTVGAGATPAYEEFSFLTGESTYLVPTPCECSGFLWRPPAK